MTDQPAQITVTVADIEHALREWLAIFEYDLHKHLECGEETGEDTYPQEAAEFYAYLVPSAAAPSAPADAAYEQRLREQHDRDATECERLRAKITEVEAQRDRRRGRLVALQNDDMDMRGSLSPNGEACKVPFELGERLAPAVDWLIGRVAELETAPADQTAEVLRRTDAYLSALHGSVARHDNLAANYGCAGCELRDQVRAELRLLADETPQS